MQRIFIWIFCFSIFSSCVNRKENHRNLNEPEQKTFDSMQAVNSINAYKDKVEMLKGSLDSLGRDIYESAENGTESIFFDQNDTLLREIVHYGETGKRLITVYQRNGQALLIQDITINYSEPISADQEVKIHDSVNNLYYLNDQNIFYWINDKEIMPQNQLLLKKEDVLHLLSN